MNLSMFILPAIFVGIAFMITKDNAKYLLSGYNTMSTSEREKVDLSGYLRFFRRFHLFLAFSLLAVTLLLNLLSINMADVISIMYILFAYGFFGFKSIRYFNPSRFLLRFSHVISSFLLVAALVILYFGIISFKESEISIQGDQLEVTGMYGLKIDRKNLTEVRLLDQMPSISSRINGFNGGSYRKGNFRMGDRSRAKLFINQNTKSYLLLKTLIGDVYYSSTDVDMEAEYRRIRAWAGFVNR